MRTLTSCKLAVVCLLVAGCFSHPPQEAVDNFVWTQHVADLDDALLSACSNDNSLYVVGGLRNRSLLLERIGDQWQERLVPQSQTLWWCWVADDGTTFAVGESAAVVRGFGNTWTADTVSIDQSVTLFGVWGSAPDDVWAVGGTQSLPDSPATIVHYDGAQWSSIDTSGLPNALLFKVWGSDANDVWAVGDGGVIFHYDGSSWSSTGSPTSQRLIALWGTSPDDVYAVGGIGTGIVLRYDGTVWSLFDTTAEALSGVWTAPGRPLYVAGNRGSVARYSIGENGTASASIVSIKSTFPDVCIHGLVGHRGGLVGAAADLIGGTSTRFRGAILGHAADLPDVVALVDRPDGGTIADAAPPQDAIGDAGPATDASGIGQSCGPPLTCEGSLQCWLLQVSNEAICTRPCNFASECTDLGVGACCERPGVQTLVTVCIAADKLECTNPI